MSEKADSNGSSLAALKNLNWPTVMLIIASGGGNLLFSQHTKQTLTYEQEEALSKIRDLHKAMDNFEDGMKASLNNQAQILNGQTQILDDHKDLLKALENGQEQIKSKQ